MPLDAFEFLETVCPKRERKLLLMPPLRTKFFGLRCGLCLHLLTRSPAGTCGRKGRRVEKRRPCVEELRGGFDLVSTLLRALPCAFGVLQFAVNLLEPKAYVRRRDRLHDPITLAALLFDAARDVLESDVIHR